MKVDFEKAVIDTLEKEMTEGRIIDWKKETADTEGELLLSPGDFWLCQTNGNMFFVLKERDLREIYRNKGYYGVREVISETVRLVQNQADQIADLRMKKYEDVCDTLIVRTVNYQKSLPDLGNKIYRITGDIALTLYMELYDGDDYYTSSKVPRFHTEGWNRSDHELLENALQNTERKYPAVVYSTAGDFLSKGMGFTPVEELDRIDTDQFFLTTEHLVNGAVAMFYPDVIRKLNRLTNGEMLMCPLTEDCVCVMRDDTKAEAALMALTETNRVFGEAVLTDMLFRYDEGRQCIVPYETNRSLN